MTNKKQLKKILESLKSTGKIDGLQFNKLLKEERELLLDFHKQGLINEVIEFIDDIDEDEQWSLLKSKLNNKNAIPLWKSISKYAAVFIAIITSIYFFQKENSNAIISQSSEDSIVLKTGENTVNILKEINTQNILSENGKIIGYQKGNKIHYTAKSVSAVLIYNELKIPYGKVFEIELSDGTTVHLNSGTTIRYPINFINGENREVFVEGEAYFKVAKDENHPFIVHANSVNVKVLGTEFNVSSYKEDPEIHTVLIEGSVSLTNTELPTNNLKLIPGNKATWNKALEKVEITTVDVNQYKGWVNGDLIFKNKTFKEITIQLERRYNVNINNKNSELAKKTLNAQFNFNVESLEDILKSINEIHPFTYKIKNKEIIIE